MATWELLSSLLLLQHFKTQRNQPLLQVAHKEVASVFMSSVKPSMILNLPFHRLLEGVGGSVTSVIQKCPQGCKLQPQTMAPPSDC